MPNKVISIDFGKSKKSNEPKRQLFSNWLDLGLVMLTFYTRNDSVLIPERFKKVDVLRLNFSYKFNIHDFNFNDKFVWATLLFEEGDSFCRLPWDSVIAMNSNELKKMAIFYDDVSNEQAFRSIFGFEKPKRPDDGIFYIAY